ncbi:unnamed protein product, partial [Brenthis ino]
MIFNYCGADNSSTLRVDVLMDKFAPFIKTNKAEYSYLKSLLDPDQSNPEISVSELAATLNKYSESQKVKADLDESFNLRSGQVPHDSDSGISTDGFQLLEELQCELREKSHAVQQLRTQLDYSDRHHEEALAAVTAERDTLRAHLNMLREESTVLTDVRRDYEEACERLCDAERARDDVRRDLDATRRRARVLTEQVAVLETEKLTLQELLSKSKDECHRINDMYASRQSTLLEENETLRAERAELAARLQDQDEFMQQLIKEKVLLEMELKDMLNKSNQTHLRMDRSIDISYTEDQMLTALDSLNADSRFVQEGRLLDEEAFVKALKEDQGRATNMSLYDEIRLSFCNMSRHNLTELNITEPFDKTSELLDTSLITVATQTENVKDMCQKCNRAKVDDILVINFGTQTEECGLSILSNKDDSGSANDYKKIANSYNTYDNEPCIKWFRDQIETKNQSTNTNVFVLQVFKDIEVMNIGTQTNDLEPYLNNNNLQTCIDCSKCIECERANKYVTKLEKDLKHSHSAIVDMQNVLDRYEDNLNVLKRFVNEGNERNTFLKSVIDSLRAKLILLEQTCDSQRDSIQEMYSETCSTEVQTECDQSSVSTQTELPCGDCVKHNTKHHSLRRFLWEPLKCLFQVFAVLCFASALYALYAVSGVRRACREPLPWRWLQPHDLLDLFLTVQYVDHVPM